MSLQTRDAAIQQGASPWQRLIKVELSIASPEVLLGINQVTLMALFMLAITALAGTQDLGSEINRARTGYKTGRALEAGFCFAFLGMIADRLIKAWLKRREELRLGLIEKRTVSHSRRIKVSSSSDYPILAYSSGAAQCCGFGAVEEM